MHRKVQQRAQDTQQRILNAALAQFSRYGYAGTTVDNIAERAKANKQRIYAYFGNKQQLFEAVVLKLFAEVDLFANADMTECPPEQLSSRLLAGFIKVHTLHPEFWRLLTWINLDNSVQVEKLVGVRSQENAGIREIFNHGVALGIIKPVTFENYLFMLLSCAWLYFSNRRTLSRTLSPDFWTTAGQELLIAEISGLFSTNP